MEVWGRASSPVRSSNPRRSAMCSQHRYGVHRSPNGSWPPTHVNPKKQRALCCDMIEAQLAESRFVFNERQVDYEKYRAKRAREKVIPNSVTITKTVKDRFDRPDDATFSRVDTGIVALTKNLPGQARNPNTTSVSLAISGE